MSGIGREVGGGGGHWRRGHPQFCVCELEGTVSLVVLEVSVPPMVGKLGGIIPRAMQAYLLRNILSVEEVK